ncbi:MAG: prolipoprotein diacylglyceryl transferase [Pseudonocardiales bacterium]|nr:MAG: prolipoprotein diacylglyceryl transferase [Pseudonocardiales bacterium]
MNLAYLPSPTRTVWQLGPIPVRAYALCIVAGAILAVVIGERRWAARGGERGTVSDVAVWAIPFGLVGARLYHVLTDPELYFGAGRDPIDALKIWDGGLGIWGAVALGAVGAWIGLRRRGIGLASFADAVAPGIAIAQAVGRIGNWFNNELYGNATTLPWGLTIHDINPSTHTATAVIGHFQPTFLYELLWDLGTAVIVIVADRRFGLDRGRAFALYVMTYTAGRAWIEYLRVDHANHLLGLRLNDWTALIVFLLALTYFLTHRGRRAAAAEAPPEKSAVTGAGSGAA